MKTYEVTVSQPRINAPEGDTTTEVYVYAFEQVKGTWHAFSWVVGWQENPAYRERYGFYKVAKVTINHPEIMAGSREDLLEDFHRIALKQLKEDGTLEEYVNGWFFSDEAVAAILAK